MVCVVVIFQLWEDTRTVPLAFMTPTFKSSQSLAVTSASKSHNGCVSHQAMHAIDSRPFHSMTIRPLITEIQFDLENSRSKVKGQRYPSQRNVFHIRASYQLPSPWFHDNRASYSRDTIWPWKFNVKGQGQRYPRQRSVHLTYLLCISDQGILSTPVPFAPS